MEDRIIQDVDQSSIIFQEEGKVFILFLSLLKELSKINIHFLLILESNVQPKLTNHEEIARRVKLNFMTEERTPNPFLKHNYGQNRINGI